MATVMTDAYFSCPTRAANGWMSRYVPLYAYEFADPAAPTYLPLVSFAYGAVHTPEMQYLFPLFHGGGVVHQRTSEQTRLSDAMVAFWTSFAATGVPTAASLPAWPRYSQTADSIVRLAPVRSAIASDFARDHHCDVWETVLGLPNVF
jgi:para-nitrobenzyl esterase